MKKVILEMSCDCEDYLLEQAVMDLFALNPLLQTREGTVINPKLHNAEVESTPESDTDEEKFMDEDIKKNH